ncbi:hypothetical protein, partial [Roseofilum sp. Belize Diploria]|uniref:hypothetical protein n=1 Tax=Roseofilum sp. Belize Diploria TaxID=2821501 RepID=UPI001B0D6EAB
LAVFDLLKRFFSSPTLSDTLTFNRPAINTSIFLCSFPTHYYTLSHEAQLHREMVLERFNYNRMRASSVIEGSRNWQSIRVVYDSIFRHVRSRKTTG